MSSINTKVSFSLQECLNHQRDTVFRIILDDILASQSEGKKDLDPVPDFEKLSVKEKEKEEEDETIPDFEKLSVKEKEEEDETIPDVVKLYLKEKEKERNSEDKFDQDVAQALENLKRKENGKKALSFIEELNLISVEKRGWGKERKFNDAIEKRLQFDLPLGIEEMMKIYELKLTTNLEHVKDYIQMKKNEKKVVESEKHLYSMSGRHSHPAYCRR